MNRILVRTLMALCIYNIPLSGGLLYETNENGNTVGIYTQAGQFTGQLTPSGIPFITPYVLAGDAAGDIYVSDYSNGRIVEFSAAGNQLGVLTTGFGNPGGLAFDGSGNLYAVDRANGAIRKFSGGSETVITTVSGARGLAYRDGLLFTASSTTGDITSFDTDGGNVTTVLSGVGSGDLRGVTFNNAGDLFISDVGSGSIFKMLSGSGTAQLFASGLLAPEFMAIDSAGTLWVPEYSGGDIRRIDSGGSDLGAVVTGLDHPSSVLLVNSPEPGGLIAGLTIACLLGIRRFTPGASRLQ